MAFHQQQQQLSSAEWSRLPDETLFGVSDLGKTPLSVIPNRTLYALIATGALGSVPIGSRRFVTKRAICEFIAAHEGRKSINP